MPSSSSSTSVLHLIPLVKISLSPSTSLVYLIPVNLILLCQHCKLFSYNNNTLLRVPQGSILVAILFSLYLLSLRKISVKFLLSLLSPSQDSFFHLCSVWNITCFLCVRDCEIVIHALISSQSTAINFTLVSINPLFSIFSLFKMLLLTSHISPVSASLHWLSVRFGIDFKTILFAHKALFYISGLFIQLSGPSGAMLLTVSHSWFKLRGWALCVPSNCGTAFPSQSNLLETTHIVMVSVESCCQQCGNNSLFTHEISHL